MSDYSELGRRFPPQPQPFYPHLSPADTLLWDPWIAANPLHFVDVWYDVHVGTGNLMEGYLPDKWTQGYRELTQKRIDVVGRTTEAFWIVEVKPRASLIAFGQVLGYNSLFDQTFHVPLPRRRAIITTHPDTDIIEPCRLENITIFSLRDLSPS